jgi:hypothetical protein
VLTAPVDTSTNSGSVSPGQMLKLTANYGVAYVASITDAPSFVGVCDDLNPLVFADGITGSPVPPNDGTILAVQIIEDGEHLFNTTSSDSYEPYQFVTIGANATTITKAPVGPTPVPTGTGSSGTWGAGTYPVVLTLLGAAGETSGGPSVNVTITSAQGIQVAALTGLASWVIGVGVYINGLLVAVMPVSSNATSTTVFNAPVDAAARAVPQGNAYAIGYVSPDQRQGSTQVQAFPISGGTGQQLYVHITPPLAK